MSLNKQKGNMYEFVTHTWNPIKGKCPHSCTYCYMIRYWRGELRFDEKCLSDDLSNKTIFVGSSTDMFAEAVPDEWIMRVLEHCAGFGNNCYLFQSKNPARFLGFWYPTDVVFGTTLETNRDYKLSLALRPRRRWEAMCNLTATTMVSIEPIMDFDLEEFTNWFYALRPDFVSIGADSKGHNLPEPPGGKVADLIAALEEFTEVRPKKNLERLMR